MAPLLHVRALVQICLGDPWGVPTVRIDVAPAALRDRAAQPWADRALVRSMRGLLTSYLRVNGAWRMAARLRMPTLVIWGDRDRLVDPRLAPRLAATVPDARLLVLEGVGHVAMLEAPEPTARAVLALVEERDAVRA
jgi:pimeloyl-ACP methyl ester carboxylesterase